MLVFGTRPEAIKMAPLVKEFQKYPDTFETIVCVTGQHRQMLDQVLKIFDITPDFDLNIMKQGQDLYDVTARVLTGMRDVLKETQPDILIPWIYEWWTCRPYPPPLQGILQRQNQHFRHGAFQCILQNETIHEARPVQKRQHVHTTN